MNRMVSGKYRLVHNCQYIGVKTIMSKRNGRGAAIAEGAAISVLVTMLAVALLLLLLNTAIVGGYSYKLLVVANETAKQINASKYWLGMPRDDFNQEEAEANGREFANALLGTFLLPNASSFSVTENRVRFGGIETPVTRVELTVLGLKTVGGVFGPIGLTATGISSENSVPPYATAVFTLHDTIVDPLTSRPVAADRRGRAVEVPAYAAFNHNNSFYSPNGSGLATRKPFTGPSTRIFADVDQTQFINLPPISVGGPQIDYTNPDLSAVARHFW